MRRTIAGIPIWVFVLLAVGGGLLVVTLVRLNALFTGRAGWSTADAEASGYHRFDWNDEPVWEYRFPHWLACVLTGAVALAGIAVLALGMRALRRRT